MLGFWDIPLLSFAINNMIIITIIIKTRLIQIYTKSFTCLLAHALPTHSLFLYRNSFTREHKKLNRTTTIQNISQKIPPHIHEIRIYLLKLSDIKICWAYPNTVHFKLCCRHQGFCSTHSHTEIRLYT